MDIKELERHARKHSQWTMQITKRDQLRCEFRQPRNSDGLQWDDYSYYLNGQRIGAQKAESLLNSLFSDALSDSTESI